MRARRHLSLPGLCVFMGWAPAGISADCYEERMCVPVLVCTCTFAVIRKTGRRSDGSAAISPFVCLLGSSVINYFSKELSIKISNIYSGLTIFWTVEYV